jgi:hypothetical protein
MQFILFLVVVIVDVFDILYDVKIFTYIYTFWIILLLLSNKNHTGSHSRKLFHDNVVGKLTFFKDLALVLHIWHN